MTVYRIDCESGGTSQPIGATIIVAYNHNFAIAQDGRIPWRHSEDFKHFKETTMDSTVIMGRKTWDSLPKKPLSGRLNMILTSDLKNIPDQPPGTYICTNILLAFKKHDEVNPGKEIFIIGGEQIYNHALAHDYVHRVIASVIDDDSPGDKFFPNLADQGWDKRRIKEFEHFEVWEFTAPNHVQDFVGDNDKYPHEEGPEEVH